MKTLTHMYGIRRYPIVQLSSAKRLQPSTFYIDLFSGFVKSVLSRFIFKAFPVTLALDLSICKLPRYRVYMSSSGTTFMYCSYNMSKYTGRKPDLQCPKCKWRQVLFYLIRYSNLSLSQWNCYVAYKTIIMQLTHS